MHFSNLSALSIQDIKTYITKYTEICFLGKSNYTAADRSFSVPASVFVICFLFFKKNVLRTKQNLISAIREITEWQNESMEIT